MGKVSFPVDEHPLYREHAEALDRYVALLEEDQALRHELYDRPDPSKRRLRVACNECETPWCCNQRVSVDIVEALAIYRWAARRAPDALEAVVKRGKALRAGRPLDDKEHFRRKMTCPFLVKGRCAIFAVRPQRCRSHYMAGNPQRCRDELAPRETYEMNPDRTILNELRAIADDVRFFAHIEDVRVDELAQALHLVDEIVRGGVTWDRPRVLDWTLVE